MYMITNYLRKVQNFCLKYDTIALFPRTRENLSLAQGEVYGF